MLSSAMMMMMMMTIRRMAMSCYAGLGHVMLCHGTEESEDSEGYGIMMMMMMTVSLMLFCAVLSSAILG